MSPQPATPADVPPTTVPIANETVLLRRVHPNWFAGEGANRTITSQAFQDSADGTSMSMHVERRLIDAGLTAFAALDGFDGYGLVSLTAGQLRAEGFTIEWDPDDGDGPRGQAHVVVHCNKSSSRRKHLRDACVVVAVP